MHLEGIYSGTSALAMIGWLVLALAPLQRDSSIAFARILALLLAVAYLAQFFFTTETIDGAGFGSLAEITALFTSPGNVMMGWTHYLAFDLFIGSWEVEDAGREGIPHWLVLPCLFLTLMLGPTGLLLYFVIRVGRRRFFPA
ncbi:ABA4-like family protein [Aquisediminimonas profunda]|uniref:ABA4-like family protein n=1 Tax=Aquisediminimonas profunda TaxID=1550733 RepID=UPI001C628134|nr:ABA4-like family protein [Aquisediminimonas profunda]